MIKSHKSYLREQCIVRRKSLSRDKKKMFSKQITQWVEQYLAREYDLGGHILCYRSLADEVDTTAIFSHVLEHNLYAPVTHKSGAMHWLSCDASTQWRAGNFNILEPIDGQSWQVDKTPAIVLCPIVGFDGHGNRIGMGKGCFDRWLSEHKQYIDQVIGLAFDCQRCPDIAPETHDVPLDAIITEQGWMRCPNT